jgi:signal transduction histidine kinase
MPVDYRRLMDGLAQVSRQLHAGSAGLAAVEELVVAIRESTGAVGATFTEYTAEGGRVVVAVGELAWALGQPIAADLVDLAQPAEPWTTRVDTQPAEVAEPLLTRGVLTIAGHPVSAGGRSVGAVHLYFGHMSESMWAETQPLLRVCAALAASAFADPGSPPTAIAAEEDDRTLFLAVAGHELRTPVTVVKGYAGMLSDRWEVLDDGSRRDAARVLNQRADDLARLVDRLLGATVGDGTSGWLVRVVPFDPIEALLRAVGELPAELRRLIRLELPNSLPPATGDPGVLISIVAELVTNAVRAMPASATTGAVSHGAIEVQAGADANTVFLRVLDRGTGIDPTNTERAFERFWRARRAGDARGGVGLGLYLVRRLVERQNGWVSLRAREGGGTVAEVRLPRADGPLRRSGEA